MKTLYVLACCLFLSAIAADFCGKYFYSRAMKLRAEASRAGENNAQSTIALSKRAMLNGNGFTALGMVMAMLGLIAWLISAILGKLHGKQPRHSIPLVMLVTYVALYCVMV
jgi:hypothetical protein